MQNRIAEIGPTPPHYSFDVRHLPVVWIDSGDRVRFTTSDEHYRVLGDEELDAPLMSFRKLNSLVGPVGIKAARPGNALIVHIETIELGQQAFVPYVARWQRRVFGVERSQIREYPIEGNKIAIGGGATISVRPMIGCAGVAPSVGELSSLSPTGPTGGNMDLVELQEGASLWLPVFVPGAMFSLGDLHAAMGRGEAVGAGFECAGQVVARFEVVPGLSIPGPRVTTPNSISFVGMDPEDFGRAGDNAVRAAWNWLVDERGVEKDRGIAICAGLLDVNFGGPAGANAVASFDLERLDEAGVVRSAAAP